MRKEIKVKYLKEEIKAAAVVVKEKHKELLDNIGDIKFINAYNIAATKHYDLTKKLSREQLHNKPRVYMEELKIIR